MHQAVAWLNEATRARVAELGSGHPLSLTAVASLAAADFELATAEESVENQERTIVVLEAAAHRLAADLSADHPQALACLENLCVADLRLALKSRQMDRARQASDALESVSRRLAVTVGESHPQALSAAANAASARRDLDKAIASNTTAALRRTQIAFEDSSLAIEGIGSSLRQLRETRAMTIKELASRAGVSERTILDIERGVRRSPRRATIRLLAGALDLVGQERVAFEAARDGDKELVNQLEIRRSPRHDSSESARYGIICGIDLGTTQSCIARIDDAGMPVVIRSAANEDTTPSAVFLESRLHAIVGRVAKNEALIAPDLVAQLVKRDMGTSVQYSFSGERHTPETVSALILRELVRAAQEQTGEAVRDVVITVPAYFGVAEREATRRAGELAGLNVLDLVAEPVAAALHYQSVTGSTAGVRHILVYDLGGGTFDTAVIRLESNHITVVCIDGDDKLGGEDWDEAIADYLIGRFAEEHPGLRPREDRQFMQEVLISAERLKRELSITKGRAHIMRFGGAVTRVELTRSMVEEITADLLERTMTVTERTIATAREKGITHFDDVMLVGGMTGMQAVTRILKDRLGLDARHHEPDLAVAKGAALFALLRTVRPASGQAADPEAIAARTGLTIGEVQRLAATRVTTVVPRGFGVKGLDGRDPLALSDPLRARQMVVHLLPANTPLPANTGPYTFATAIENQRLVGIEVWEQTGPAESEDLAENRKIGEGMLRNLPPRLPAGTPLEVTFFMSETGLLTVQATEPGSGTNLRFDLQIGDLDQAGMDKARLSVARYQVSA